jgi:hypothetical protein
MGATQMDTFLGGFAFTLIVIGQFLAVVAARETPQALPPVSQEGRLQIDASQ